MELYKEYIKKYPDGIGTHEPEDYFGCMHRVKFDLFTRFGAVAASGDRHLAEFCPGNWYLKDPQTALDWGFSLTPVRWRKKDLKERLQKSADLQSGAIAFAHGDTGEEGVNQIRALAGLDSFVTNVNVPNVGQIPNLPLGAVVETNALFSKDSVQPLVADNVPEGILSLMLPAVQNQLTTVQAALTRDLDLAFRAFCADRLCDRLSPAKRARCLTRCLRIQKTICRTMAYKIKTTPKRGGFDSKNCRIFGSFLFILLSQHSLRNISRLLCILRVKICANLLGVAFRQHRAADHDLAR